jgi:hypothetical protein
MTPPPVSLVVDVCATGLADAASYTKGAFESEAFADADPPSLGESLTPELTNAFGFLNRKDPEELRTEAQRKAAFEAVMAPGRQLHEAEKVAGDAVVAELLMESLGKPTPRKERQSTEEVYAKQKLYYDVGGGKEKQKLNYYVGGGKEKQKLRYDVGGEGRRNESCVTTRGEGRRNGSCVTTRTRKRRRRSGTHLRK